MPKGRPYRNDISAAVREGHETGEAVRLTEAQFAALGHDDLTPVRAIRRFCLDCMGGSSAEVARCTSVGCSLFGYRLGKKPAGKHRLRVLGG